ncbi:hypothetical protein [Chondromyces crocatus]|uniref:Uncharacterized protein n=1 Tax=Chondromyces crocatus TaxID=52 RepID=A0A0K1E508_CHOCO|nr:hypothetical protein [Chondromyces crocatus]AKT35965.1 uncharacterized protein CMC5_000770 [Chondromyces crocatus]
MPSLTHEALLHLFRSRPALAAEMLRDTLGAPVPAFTEARIASAELTEVIPVERHADLVVLLLEDCPVLAIVVEAQLGRDSDKEYAWPSYAIAVRSRYRCRTCLLVVTTDLAIARWSAAPIDLGPPRWVLEPYVLGPKSMPLITDSAEAKARPEVAVLSAMAHGRGSDGLAIGIAALAAAAGLAPEQQRLYVDLVLSSVNEAAKRSLEEMMKSGHEYQSEFARNYTAQGRDEGLREGRDEGLREGVLQGKAQSVLAVLEARGLAIPVSVQERVLASVDVAELEGWIRRAMVVGAAADLFATTPS